MTKKAPEAGGYPDRLQNFEKHARTLSSAQPAVMSAFWDLHKAAVSGGALDSKTKELITLAISVATHCDDCIAHHTHDALEAGASSEEIADALGVAILMGGGTSVVYATHAIRALEEFSGPAG
ncbi:MULTISPECIES: carboxymuconolactone decarboxylase family protein [Microbulbifer]|uniref:carboxymuconolactone decarboxylase family protein n=1 Tax=Microbulbifer TaxID=48073 RepID=UPI001E3B6101|nr:MULTISPECIES: carboxymuconolactone decarboxylase family protein [Microbulbifer]UHQ56252.1 carboxymuconolactone decarboxylase family protein [Microbulbifer sp. YPW16]